MRCLRALVVSLRAELADAVAELVRAQERVAELEDRLRKTSRNSSRPPSRHPAFQRVSWKFVDAHVEQTLAVRGYWRSLPKSEQDAVARRFWEVGRLTLEYWLTPRLAWDGIHRWPGTEVVEVTPVGDDKLRVLLSDGTGLAVDRVVFGSGYRADLTKVPYLAGVLKHVKVSSSFPVLDEAFQTSLDGLYVTGFSATQDFGPFFGFVKGSPAAATLIVRDLLSRR